MALQWKERELGQRSVGPCLDGMLEGVLVKLWMGPSSACLS